MRKIAIYDLDKTVLRRSTFTPFLFFAARRHERRRIALAPAWFAAMALYKLGLFTRSTLKQFGLRLFLGRRMTPGQLEAISEAFADHAVARWTSPAAARAMARDRAEGCTLILGTAAMEFYAAAIARRLGFDHVVGTRARPLSTDLSACLIEGENCYGPDKRARVKALLDELGWRRSDCMIRFYTDSVSDGPLLAWSDQPVLVNPGPRARRIATAKGWELARFD